MLVVCMQIETDRLKFQSVQSVSIGIQDSANRPLGRFPPLPKDLPNSMSVIALILVDLWGGGYHIYIYMYIGSSIKISMYTHALCYHIGVLVYEVVQDLYHQR